MHKRYVLMLFIFAIFASVLNTGFAFAVDVSDPPLPINYSPIFISGFQVTNQIDAVEIYNESSDPVDLSDWSIQYKSAIVGEVCKIQLTDWILPAGYVTAVASGSQLGSLMEKNDNVRGFDSCLKVTEGDFSLTLNKGDLIQETITPTAASIPGAFVRKGLTKTYRTNKFSTDFIPINRSLYAGEWYQPPQSLQIEFTEILINSRNCSPLEVAVDCNDYVKLYNPTDQPIDLADYRIRNGYLGQSPSTSNTTELIGIVDPGHFIIIPMTVTNSAQWLWLEDSYGVERYDNTVLDYPDASSDTKKGQAWAYDVKDGIWKWTTQPTPLDSSSVFPTVPTPVVTVVEKSYVPCAEGQYRSEVTNRCRSVVSEVASLIPCGPGQTRNPETNRCRSNSAVLGTSSLVPCKEGQERNPDTNRCRNIVGLIPDADYAPKRTSEGSNDFILWLSLGAVGLVAVGYAVWEWRREISHIMQKFGAFLKPRK